MTTPSMSRRFQLSTLWVTSYIMYRCIYYVLYSEYSVYHAVDIEHTCTCVHVCMHVDDTTVMYMYMLRPSVDSTPCFNNSIKNIFYKIVLWLLYRHLWATHHLISILPVVHCRTVLWVSFYVLHSVLENLLTAVVSPTKKSCEFIYKWRHF